MKRSMYKVAFTSLLLLPAVAMAEFDASGGQFGQLLVDILAFANNVLIPFILGIGFLFFVFGVFRYFILGGANDEAKEKGRSLIIYATLGFVLIIIFWGVVNLLTGSSGFSGQTLENIPSINTSGGAGGE